MSETEAEVKKEKKEKVIPYLEEIPFFGHQKLIVLRNKGIDPELIDEYPMILTSACAPTIIAGNSTTMVRPG